MPTAIFSYCNGGFDALIEQKPFSGVSWSNVNVLIQQWINWIKLFVFQTDPRRKKRRFHLSLWVTPSTSNLIKRLETTKRNQPISIQKFAVFKSLAKIVLHQLEQISRLSFPTQDLQVNCSSTFEPSNKLVFLLQSFTEMKLRLIQNRKAICSLNSSLAFLPYLQTSSQWKNAFPRSFCSILASLKSKFSIL